ncbi:FG-GAP-like repeat-containing protein [Leptospira bandrabouensis]|uniref:FG-GAP-like repeat-containing protein n=2 Tax=Leptospira bandrabouensis TaxID=2484903 RepID=UPI001EE97405|nr:FG-GAP-like repeat-containing protein [Leptospira bandrabouensis]MCG6145307.1 VCBS repeat-containing protein [Leptospira bandrabouensis]MCG6152340.1 VCBS repeat-containing protein [Leptospira bandrabouensis]MCG6160931.1 VCBS repeat-containing protein [Leptospira bandrabouensis]MCG6164945.1 VCBS repeat-containing protein [Leptospira bandrabouensis]
MKYRTSNQILNLRLITLGISLFLLNCWANPLTHPPIECLMKLSNSFCPDKNLLEKWSPYIFLSLLPESSVTISNLTNHSIVETGFVVGTAPAGHPFVNVWTDDIRHTEVPIIDGTWRYPLPAKAVTNTFWTYGSLHTISVHLPFEKPKTIQVRMGTNHDTDGDGYPDLIVSATPANNVQGYGYVYRTNSLTKQLTTSPVTTLTDGQTTATYFGCRIGSGDFNGDGYADILVGAQAYIGAIGRVYVFLSKGQQGIPSQNLNTGGSADAILDGVTGGGRFGTNIIGADINRDGYDDGIFASPWENELFIFYSQGTNAFSSLNTNSANFVFKNPFPANPDDNFGTYAYAGDVNGDGFLDLVVSAATHSSDLGRIYIFVSNQGTLPNQPQQFLYPPTNPAPGCAGGCRFGTNFALDYFNSDKCIDLAVGAPTFNSNQGIVFVYHSSCDATNPYSNPPVATLIGPPTNSCNGNNCSFGGNLASGDTNGDGLPDLLIGATGASSGIGDVYLVLNDPNTGLRNMNLSAGGAADSLFSGSIANRNFSQGLQFQDTNADGLQDIVISEPLTTNLVYTFHSIRGGVPASQNLNGTGVTNQTLSPPAGTSLGNTIAELKIKAEGYLWALVTKTKVYFGWI